MEGNTQDVSIQKERHIYAKCFKERFLTLKKTKSEIVFGRAMIWDEKLNCHERLPRSQRNSKEVYIWYKDQPFSSFGKKQKGLRSKCRFGPKYNFLILPEGGQKDVFLESLKIKWKY